jgi:hypothetical protein
VHAQGLEPTDAREGSKFLRRSKQSFLRLREGLGRLLGSVTSVVEPTLLAAVLVRDLELSYIERQLVNDAIAFAGVRPPGIGVAEPSRAAIARHSARDLGGLHGSSRFLGSTFVASLLSRELAVPTRFRASTEEQGVEAERT